MTSVYKNNNSIIINGGKIGISADCCCNCCSKAAGESITVLANGVQYTVGLSNTQQNPDFVFSETIQIPVTGDNIFGANWTLVFVCENGTWTATIIGPCFAPIFCQPTAQSVLPKDPTTCLPLPGAVSWSDDLSNCDNWPPGAEPAPFPPVEIL